MIARLRAWLGALRSLSGSLRRIELLEAAASRQQSSAGDHQRRTDALEAALVEHNRRSDALEDALGASNRRVDALEARGDGLAGLIRAVEIRAGQAEEALGQLAARVDGNEAGSQERQLALRQELAHLEVEQQALRRDWRSTLMAQESAMLAAARRIAAAELPPAQTPGPRWFDGEAAYRRFEDAHHLEWKVRERKNFYLPDALAASRELPGRTLLDIGCGRGEWLQVMSEAGLPARGVDINPEMAETARAAGLDVVISDAIAHLAAQEAGSLAAISAFHLIEHLPFATLLELLEQCWRALAPGGLLILETPNPENLIVGACNFWMDVTHLKPLPPGMTSFHVAAFGFTELRLRRFYLQEDLSDRMTENETAPSFLRPQEWLSAAYDYGLLARKPRLAA